MKDLFTDVLSMDGVTGILLLSSEGDILFKEFANPALDPPESKNWNSVVSSLQDLREADAIFKDGRVYVRKTDLGYLLVTLDSAVSIAMLRLNVDILLPSLKPAKSGGKLSRLFRK